MPMNKKDIRKEMKQIEREIGRIARISRFMTEEQLRPYEKKASRHMELKLLLEQRDKPCL